jgi:hypothetical protein
LLLVHFVFRFNWLEAEQRALRKSVILAMRKVVQVRVWNH